MVRVGKSGNGPGLDIPAEHCFWLAFSCLRGVGPKRFSLLLNFFGSAQRAWEAAEHEWRQLGLPYGVVAQWKEARQNAAGEKVLASCREGGVRPVFLDDPAYPRVLRSLADPPFVLYLQGEYRLEDEKAIAVVGTRRMTAYGGQVADSLSTELVAAGVTVVSGLARGIDETAHRAAVQAGGRTIGVLGSGHARMYPRENTGLAKQIIESGGAIFSEYPPDTSPHPAQFPARNRLIAGLSRGVVVVEGGIQSGSLITARLAADQGKEVFAVPGPVFQPGSQGPAHLIQSGAVLVLKADDILREFSWTHAESKKAETLTRGTPIEERICFLLSQEPKHVNQLSRELEKPVGEVTGLLTMMELKKIVVHMGGMVYRKAV